MKKENKLIDIFNNKLKDDFDIFSKKINEIFKNTNKTITDMIFKLNKKHSRNNKLTFNDAVNYFFNYCLINSTKSEIVANLNYDNNLSVHQSNYQKKEAKIPLKFYEEIFIKIKTLFYDKYTVNNNKNNIICVDGTYNNTNLYNDKNLETSLNMGYYDFSNKIPVNIKFKGKENKNKEIKSFIDDLEKNNLPTNNIIFIFDRAYYSENFINYLDSNNYKYVIRVKKSCLYLDKVKNEKKIEKKIKVINNKNIRFIKHEHKYKLNIRNNKNKIVLIEKTCTCFIASNLDNEYTDDKIKDFYRNRWSVEVFFKILKLNFKFSNLTLHTKTNTKNQYEKLYNVILIQYYIVRIIENIYNKNNDEFNKHKFKSKNKNKYVIKHNNSLMIKGIIKIISSIINNTINKDILFKYSTNYIVKINVQIDIYNERKCKNPSFKWYIKSYAEYYKNNTIINALKNNKVDELNKNLKLFASEIKIIN